MNPIDRAVAALIADLHRREETFGCVAEDNGSLAQVDGSFKVEPLVRAVILALREPSAIMSAVGGLQTGLDGHQITPQIAEWTWERMIDALLAKPACAGNRGDLIDNGEQGG
jgi:hypothetical protein